MTTTTQLPSANPFSWDKRNLDGIEQLADGVTLQWLEHGRIVCFTVTTVARPSVDAWLNCSEAVVKAWPRDIPYLCLHDAATSSLTPYIRDRSAQVVAATPKYLEGRSAVVMPRSIMSQAVRLFVTVSLVRQNSKIQRNVFLSKVEALRWLGSYGV